MTFRRTEIRQTPGPGAVLTWDSANRWWSPSIANFGIPGNAADGVQYSSNGTFAASTAFTYSEAAGRASLSVGLSTGGGTKEGRIYVRGVGSCSLLFDQPNVGYEGSPVFTVNGGDIYFGLADSNEDVNPAWGSLVMHRESGGHVDGVSLGTDRTLEFSSAELAAQSVFINGWPVFWSSSSAPAIATGGTISIGTLGSELGTTAVTPAAAVTGVILPAGSNDGQTITVINKGAAASIITFAAAGTSRVANGTSCVIAGQTAREFSWHGTLWYEK